MRQPPRQPPRQQPKPAARKAAPKAPPKTGATAAPKAGAKPGVKATQSQAQQATNYRAAQHARDAQRATPRQTAGDKPQSGQQPRASGAPGRPLRGWRSWWATHEMDRRQRGRRVAHSQVGGGFTILRNWGAGRVTAILTLLLLALFTGAIALGAQSFVAAITAFLFLGGALAIATAMQAQHFYSSSPPDTGPPLENIADLRMDDIKIDEEDDSEVNSMDALHRSFDKGGDTENSSSTSAGPEITETQKESSSSPRPPATTAESEDKPSSPAPPTDNASEAAEPGSDDSSTAAAEAAETPQEAGAPSDDASEGLAPPATQQEAEYAATKANRVFVVGADETSAAADSGPASNAGAAPSIPQQRESSRDSNADLATAEAAGPPPGSAESAQDALRDDPIAEGADQDSGDTVAEDTDSGTATTLSLLSAETPGTNLLAAYTASNTVVPPETVRDVAATLIVSNLDRSIMFYTELLGLVEIDRAPDAVLLEAGFGRVLLWRRDDAPGAGDPVMHLTFEVGDIDRAYQSLSTKGVRFTHPPVSALSGEIHDLRAASFLDPDGHGLAITQLREH